MLLTTFAKLFDKVMLQIKSQVPLYFIWHLTLKYDLDLGPKHLFYMSHTTSHNADPFLKIHPCWSQLCCGQSVKDKFPKFEFLPWVVTLGLDQGTWFLHASHRLITMIIWKSKQIS